MKKDREILENNLINLINEVKYNKKRVLKINKNLSEVGVPLGTFDAIARGDQMISGINDVLLCVLTSSVYNETLDCSVKTEEFFTQDEINKANKNIEKEFSAEDIIRLPLAISNVEMIELDNYITKIDLSFLVDMSTSQLIIYDPETQRGHQYKKRRDGGIVEAPIVNKASVEKISEKMLNQEYMSDMMTINVYSTEVEPFTYNEKTKTLMINDGATVSILDGFHRLQAGIRAKSINPSFSQPMILSIRSYDEDTAKKYFGQINTINVLKKERREELKSEKMSDVVVRDIMRKSELKGKIASDTKISEIAGQLTTFNILSYAIDKVFKPENMMSAKESADYLIDFFNYLTGFYVDEFIKNPNKYRDTYINHPLVFLGYVAVAKAFSDNEKPLKELKNIVEKINFKDNSLVSLLESSRGMNSKPLRNQVIKYFENVIGEVM